jgi:hypothetical protein
MGLTVMMAGQDITDFVDELSIDIDWALAQGSGTGNGFAGRAGTCTFITTLGPAYSAVGAGTPISSPQLVRMGEVSITDATGARIFGGFASQLEDQTQYTRIYTRVTVDDFWQFCDRIIIENETFANQSDIQIIRYLLNKYAPWIDQSALPTAAAYIFPTLPVRSKSLQWAIQKIADTVGYQVYITPSKKIFYQTPLQAQTAPFFLSTSPTFNTSFPLEVTDLTVDDTAAINRVFFYGGKRPSDDFTQDLSPQVNGSNSVFTLAYYPREASDGKVHATVNGVEQVIGFALGDTKTPSNVFKSKGGTADALLNSDAHTLAFDVAPAQGDTVLARYRYEIPLVIVVTNPASLRFYGMFLDAIISDQNVFDSRTAVQRCQTLLLQQAFGLRTIKANCWKAGLQPGMLLPVVHTVRGIDETFVVQEVHVVPLGAGKFRYELTLGAWNWNLIDVLVQLAGTATAQNDNTEEDTVAVDILIPVQDATLHEVVLHGANHQMGVYYARSTPVGDGHDAYPGFFSISS